jgi:DNA-binding LacI/PurR family transcriptional regulator
MNPTIKEIAKKAKVSIATVSRVLNNNQKVTEKTKNLVLKVSKELNYKPNILARNFVKKKSNVIGLILPEISDEFFTEIIRGVDEITYQEGYYTIVASSHKYRTLHDEVTTFTQNGLIGGLIVLVPNLNKELTCLLKNVTIPTVLINSHPGNTIFNTVAIDNFEGAYLMTEFLINEKGYKKIGFISGPDDNNDSNLRKEGYISACKKYKNTSYRNWAADGNFTRESGENGCGYLIEREERPEVIFAANDMMALGCYDYLSKKGLNIPSYVGIAGFDDIFVSQYLTPSLTTIRIKIEEVGRSAADLLMKKLKTSNGLKNVRKRISVQLVVRNSC